MIQEKKDAIFLILTLTIEFDFISFGLRNFIHPFPYHSLLFFNGIEYRSLPNSDDDDTNTILV